MMEKYKIVVGHITLAMSKQTPRRDHVRVKIYVMKKATAEFDLIDFDSTSMSA